MFGAFLIWRTEVNTRRGYPGSRSEGRVEIKMENTLTTAEKKTTRDLSISNIDIYYVPETVKKLCNRRGDFKTWGYNKVKPVTFKDFI